MLTQELELLLAQLIDDRVVPIDEGNGDALLFNILETIRTGVPRQYYSYQPEQGAYIKELRSKASVSR